MPEAGKITKSAGPLTLTLTRTPDAHFFTEARYRGARRATLEVRMSNAVALKLYAKYGFETVAIRRKYYQDTDEDALLARAHPAWMRIKFDELLAQQLSMRVHYRERSQRISTPQFTAQYRLTSVGGARLGMAVSRKVSKNASTNSKSRSRLVNTWATSSWKPTICASVSTIPC